MDYEMKKYMKKIKKKRIEKKENSTSFNFYVSKLLIVVILTLITLIALKTSSSFKNVFYKNVYEKNISFATINKYYQSYFGSPLPFSNLFSSKTETVFNEKLEYSQSNIYKDGVVLTVTSNYMVPIIESGMVTFIGEKDGYGNTVIVEDSNGVSIWYSNITNVSVKMYDYVEKGSFLGNSSDNKLYLVFKKEGEVLDYKEYIS